MTSSDPVKTTALGVQPGVRSPISANEGTGGRFPIIHERILQPPWPPPSTIQKTDKMKIRKWFGPSTLVTAAFIGPGTLTTCTKAGIHNGYDLLWALMFAGLATIVLQEMAARLGWVTGRGLGEAVRSEFKNPVSRFASFALITSAILIGNAAYESGNLAGAVIGWELLFGPRPGIGLAAGFVCGGLLWWGGYRWLERILIVLVLAMSACFLATAVVVRPDPVLVLQGLRPQAISSEMFLTIMGLIGTTVVPYNLFLHASAISKKWGPEATLNDIRTETCVAVGLGIAISMLIVVTSAATRGEFAEGVEVVDAKTFAIQLEPAFGRLAKFLMGIGFLAAGLSSALTAPLAAAFAARGLFHWPDSERNKAFISVWAVIILIGVVVGQSGVKLVSIILFAQVSNAVMLPLVAIFLFRLVNSERVMGEHRNKVMSNILGAIVLCILMMLSVASFTKLFW